MSRIVLVAIGSNTGDSAGLVQRAMNALEALSAAPIGRSSLWRSAPVDCPPGSPDFINAAALLSPLPGETPETLLRKLQELEREFGRRPKTVMNEARPLDLDLIAFGDETRNSEGLLLPHPRAHLRGFVLGPLAEVAADFVWPGQGKTVGQLLRDLPREKVERLND